MRTARLTGKVRRAVLVSPGYFFFVCPPAFAFLAANAAAISALDNFVFRLLERIAPPTSIAPHGSAGCDGSC